MIPQNKLPNAMELSSQSSANMLGTLGDSVNAAMPSEQPPTDSAPNPVMEQFKNAWSILKSLNASGGDADKFRAVQKALEDWVSDIVQQAPDDSASQTSSY